MVGGGGGRGGGVKEEEIIIVGRSELVAGYVADEGSKGYVFDLSRDDDEFDEFNMFDDNVFSVNSIEWPFDERRSGSGAIIYDDDTR